MSFVALCPKKVIRKALAGDKFAFAQIYNTYKQPVYSLAYRMLQDVDASSDILQQVFLKVMTRLDDINDHTKLGSWIKRITYNCVIDYIRANSRESLGINDDYFADDFLAPQHISFDDYDLDVLLSTLNARERSVLILFSVEEYTHQEIASMLSISESNSKQIYSRALKKLSQLAELERYSGNKVGSYD
ncbi:sigma-70 family RNA polymerase sigma factor [Kangiella profundi]|uniref:Sigma-70 family RNA polymerase sigma factor n=1 Tax=Kangiella profundi TaxID=1561924 RepID=A0A2K9AM28_9GAMM|nr:sigma-70 family RNA polymerase sigma factor [Kangiella profundi]AUD78682.1 sigma-70 family RNA polymerase sigma factor [Kangiella profundi]GGE90366.1 ECF subfamily RNA polymerase sigma factor [Kangiella profundi]